MPTYIRLHVTQLDPDSLCPMGVFMASSDLRDSVETHPVLVERVRSVREWFNDNLPDPQDAGWEVCRQAIFWFKPEAVEPIGMAWKLAALLDEGGYLVRRVTCRRPGKVVFEDDYQVAAIPFRDTRSRL